VLSPLLASVLPFGLNTQVAALVMRADRWTAGGALMKAADPQRWNGLVASAGFVHDHQDAIDACRKAQIRSGKSQPCLLDLPASDRPEPQ
jgi:hypothetical protein